MQANTLVVSFAASFIVVAASGQGTEATRMHFVGTATGSGTLIGGVPWAYTGTASQSFTKKSGGGSTGGGFSARSDPSWFAQSSATFYYSIDPDGVRFGTELRATGNLPIEFVQTGNVQSSVAAEFDFVTDEIYFYSGAYDPTGMFYSFSTSTAYAKPKLLFPGSHSVDLNARGIGVSTISQRIFDRFSPMNRFIRLTPLPIGYADQPGRAFGEFRNAELRMSRDGGAAFLTAKTTDWWDPTQNFLRFLWRENQQASYLGAGTEVPIDIAASGDILFFTLPNGQIRRDTPGGSSILTWPPEVLSATFTGTSAAGDVVVAEIYDPNSTNAIGLWSASNGFSLGPRLPGLVVNSAYVSPRVISGDGQVIAARWSNQPEGFGLPSDGQYVARVDGTFAASLGDMDPVALNHDGTIAVGSRWTGSGYLPVVWRAGAVHDLPLPDGFSGGQAQFLADDASIIIGVGVDFENGSSQLVWSDTNAVETLAHFLDRRRIDFSEVPNDYFQRSNRKLLAMSSDGETIACSNNVSEDGAESNTRVYMIRLTSLCASDLNLDRTVDDTDFVLFAEAYNQLVCPDPVNDTCWADINADGFVNDDDFVLFAAAYDQLLCP